METNLVKKVNFLITYATISTFFILFLILNSFRPQDRSEKFDEITVKKITVTGEDNLPRIVLSNESRQHSGRMKGKDLAKRERPAGIIFFNNEGDECGGLIANVSNEKGAKNSGMSFTMDNYHDDQIIQILNDETYENGKAEIQRGLTINEYPAGSDMVSRNEKFEELEKIKDKKIRDRKMNELWNNEGSKKRLFVGRNLKNDTGLFLYDPKGKIKMMIYVDKEGSPKIQTFNDKGESKNLDLNK